MMLPMVSSAFGRFRGPRRTLSNEQLMPSSDSKGGDATPHDSQGSFYPGLYDVLKARYILRWKLVPEGLPVEIVDMIVDAAEYWASVESKMDGETSIRQDGDKVVVRTGPLCYDEKTLGSPTPKVLPHRTVHPCRKIVFFLSSHDQGWGSRRGENQFNGSFTWFDTEVVHSAHQQGQSQAEEPSPIPEPDANGIRLGPGHPLLNPSHRKLQSNRTQTRDAGDFTITWHYLDNIKSDSVEAEEIERAQGRGRATLDGSQIRGLEVGDAILVWARARYGGWVNYVEEASVRVFWAV